MVMSKTHLQHTTAPSSFGREDKIKANQKLYIQYNPVNKIHLNVATMVSKGSLVSHSPQAMVQGENKILFACGQGSRFMEPKSPVICHWATPYPA